MATTFGRQIKETQERLFALGKQGPSRELTAKLCVEISRALEELRAGEEKLRSQNERIAAAHQALATERSRIQDILNSLPNGILITDLSGTIEEANSSAAAMFSAPKEYILGRPLVVFLPEKDRKAFRHQLARTCETARPVNWEATLVPGQGEPFGAVLDVCPLSNSEGKPIALRWLVRNQTPAWNVPAPELEMNPYPVVEMDLAGKVHYTNVAADRLFPDLRECGWQHAWLADLETLFNPKQNGCISVSRDIQIGELWYEQTIYLFSEGKRIRIFGSDITPRKRMEEALRRSRDELETRVKERTAELADANEVLWREIARRKVSEEKLRIQAALMEFAHDPIIVRDTGDKILSWNQGAEKTYGWTQGEAIGQAIDGLLRTQFPKAKEEIRRDILHTGDWQGEVVHTSRDGKKVQVESRQTLLRDVKGKPLRILEINRDITERKRAEEINRESEARLKYLSSQLLMAQEQERKRIALELHDSLAADLAAIKFALERKLISLQQDPSSGIRIEEVIGHIQRTIEEVRNIMNNLRPSILDDLGILPTVSWFCREFESIYTGIAVERKTAVQEEDVPKILKIVIFRVLQEAMNNVAKHSRANRVRVSLTGENGRIDLEIEDNGRGFDPSEKYSVNEQKGLGLGSMKERVELSGGTFAIDSAAGKGTLIRARWPENLK